MAFTVKMTGDFSLKEEMTEVIADWKLFKQEFINIGRNTHKFMIEYIKANSKGTSNATGIHLHDEIDFNYRDEPFRVVVEIGDIAKLNARAPYMWKLINYGGAHPLAKFADPKRRFVPVSYLSEKFISGVAMGGGFVVSRNARIKAINYIQNAEHYGTAEYLKLIALSTIR